jgi:hypothetical protein
LSSLALWLSLTGSLQPEVSERGYQHSGRQGDCKEWSGCGDPDQGDGYDSDGEDEAADSVGRDLVDADSLMQLSHHWSTFRFVAGFCGTVL